jgi:hypothetical protein
MSISSNSMDGETALVTEPGVALAALSRWGWPGASPGIDRGQWAAAIGVNVIAVANLSFLLLPAMIANG